MCESVAFLRTAEGEQRIMEYVIDVRPEGDGRIYLADILGEEKIVEGTLKEIKLLEHKIIIEANKTT